MTFTAVGFVTIVYAVVMVIIGFVGVKIHPKVVSKDTFVYLTTSEMRTPHYSEHFNLTQ